MRFQVISSTVNYSNSFTPNDGRLTLEYSVFPYKNGTLRFSDGNRLVARDLSEKRGGPLTLGDLYGTSSQYESVFGDGKNTKTPIDAKIFITTEDINDFSFLKNREYACGFAHYSFEKYNENLAIILFVKPGVFSDLLQIRADSPAEMFFDVDIRGLAETGYGDSADWLSGLWDLDDNSDCGKGDHRIIIGFSLRRTISYFPPDPESDRRQIERKEHKNEIEKLRFLISNIVAIQNGTEDGAVSKILRLNLYAALAIVVLGIIAVVRLYF